ncbi:MAG: M20/M25/M40 family metallo-hydrolase [Bacteroidota bacterium]|nr:M20/M25/M40 family metallo-hydrolase [Bacteroidota bacterium]
MRKLSSFVLILLLLQARAQEKIDTAIATRIRLEALQHSNVMDIAYHLTDESGPRLMNSPGFIRAAKWAVSRLQQWGLEGAAMEPWGSFGKSWELEKSYIAMTAPYYKPLLGYPKTWTMGTGGLQNASVIIINAKDSAELPAYSGKLKGKLILLPPTDTFSQSFTADATRFTDEQLQKMADFVPGPPDTSRRNFRGGNAFRMAAQINRIKEMMRKEGAVGIVSGAARGHDGTIFVQGGGAYAVSAPENFTDIVLAYEDYMSLYRLAAAGNEVKVETDIKTRFNNNDSTGYNVVAEIKGTDKKLKDEIVMIGGHLDSWHSGTGATDDAAGCAVMMEAVRILKAMGVKPRRTIRIALWGAEEEGLIGSRNYVRNHFTDTATRKFNAAGDKIAAYFNLDNGTGKIRGVYAQGNKEVVPIFKQWLQPFADLGASTVTLQNTGGTDHLSFDAIGLPGFQFIQDPIEYSTRTHHTNMDTYDHLIPADLQQAAAVIASFVYNAAMRDEKLPRKAFTPAPARGF